MIYFEKLFRQKNSICGVINNQTALKTPPKCLILNNKGVENSTFFCQEFD